MRSLWLIYICMESMDHYDFHERDTSKVIQGSHIMQVSLDLFENHLQCILPQS